MIETTATWREIKPTYRFHFLPGSKTYDARGRGRIQAPLPIQLGPEADDRGSRSGDSSGTWQEPGEKSTKEETLSARGQDEKLEENDRLDLQGMHRFLSDLKGAIEKLQNQFASENTNG